MMADTMGMFISSGQFSSPLRYLTSGVFRLTGDILRRGIARDQQVLAKGAGRFFVEISHIL